MAGNKQGYKEKRSAPSASLLTGLLFDRQGHRLIPSHSRKQSKRYRYYVSEPLISDCREKVPDGLRLPAQELETIVINLICNWLGDADAILDVVHSSPENIQAIQCRSKYLSAEITQETPERYQLIRLLIIKSSSMLNIYRWRLIQQFFSIGQMKKTETQEQLQH
jgi:hypothetical protein